MPLPENKVKPSTRHHVVNERFAAILSEDFGIETRVILDALVGEPQRQAIFVCEWASRTDDPAHALLCWSKKHDKGRCRRQRTAADRPSRRQAEISGSPGGDRTGDGRGSGPGCHDGIAPGRSWGFGVGREKVLAGLERMGG